MATIIPPIPRRIPMFQPDGVTLTTPWEKFLLAIADRLGGAVGAVSAEHGGTGATSLKEARWVLGVPSDAADLGAVAAGVDISAKGEVTSTHLDSPLPIAQGGTGADNAADARTNLGISEGITTGTILHGIGNPNGVVAAQEGVLYLNGSGGAGSTLWVKESGDDTDTGWVAK